MSALIIMNHVKEGVDLALAYGLPGPVVDIIGEHHGQSLIKFFYQKALDQDGDAVDEKQFRYWSKCRGEKVELIVEPTQGEEEKFGAIAGIRYAMEQLGDEEYLVVAGDNLFDFSGWFVLMAKAG